MLKGAQKRIYVVKLGQESPFEEAYFVLKRECDAVQGKDMVSEATRIIKQSAGQERTPAQANRRAWQVALGFACGFVTGGGIAAAICLLV